MGMVVIGAVFVDIKGYPTSAFIPTGRNAGRVEQIHGGVGRNVAEDIANCELRPTFVSLVDDSGTGVDVACPPSFTRGIHGPELETRVKGVRGCVHVVNGGLTESLEDIAGFPLLNAEAQGPPPRRDDTPCGRCCAFCRNA